MPIIQCPVASCEYTTDDVDSNVAVVLLSLHATDHVIPNDLPSPRLALARTGHTSSLDYKQATNITGHDAVIKLLECYDEQLRRDLTRNAGSSLTGKRFAVYEENSMVAWVHLHNMRQDRDETVRSFGARLRRQAGVCTFMILCLSCSATVNYTDAILCDIQLDLLSDTNQNMTLEEAFQFIEAKEAG